MGITALMSLVLGYMLSHWMGKIRKNSSERLAHKILEEAKLERETQLKTAKLEVKEEIFRARTQFESEMRQRREELVQMEKRIVEKERVVEKRLESIDRKESDLRQKEKMMKSQEETLSLKEKELESLLEKEHLLLQNVSGISRDEARKELLGKIQAEVKEDAALMIRQSEARVREEVSRKAQWLMVDAVGRCAMDHVQEITVTAVALPSDEHKGKIIGRDGRNIRTFEAATGVDLIIDDTPDTVVISAFDMVRREIARLSLEQLIRDGRIHPARIEEVVERIKKEIDESIRQAGEKAVFQMGLSTVHPEIVKLLGRLKYRTSYGQNVLEHSKEVGWLMGVMAAELGLDIKTARRAGLLHDLGKALSHEIEGPHALIGGDFARKYGESEEVIAGIAGHHNELPEPTLWGVLTQAADALSAARPGARSDTVEHYLQRLEKLEGLANAFPGVEKTYAIEAGREIRVIVKPQEINDDGALVLSRDIAKKIKSELQYPGIIKVTVIRETRVVEYAR
ncbi:MAG: ribonuclease Y [Chlamydiae bacterium]|nr:ribonuclease Y [Chlamydiota bacterium]MBI3276149.1 ribonuclease Y [Chlamydiota bacterium]